MNPERRTVDCMDVPLGADRMLRLALYRDADGQPETLCMALGWGAGPQWREDRAEGLCVNADALPWLRSALDALASAEAGCLHHNRESDP